MRLAVVRGTVVSTQKEPTLTGVKFLMVQYLDQDGNPQPDIEVAADPVGAGVDEWVLVSRGSAARQPRGNETRPLDAVVIAIVDTVSQSGRSVYSKRDHF
ncbi:MAG: EutN/CcmL family microcompartment protein [Synechococcaceae cyanobacterium SM2_3_2]|nr:EutN/CcmL family microcompartment protein [Synechococcaceae cyanobacterium SM2_3_2]